MSCERNTYSLLTTPIGWVGVVASEELLTNIYIALGRDEVMHAILVEYPSAVMGCGGMTGRARQQLSEYFNGARRCFELPIDWSGRTDFAKRILQQLAEVPFGETLTYAELARLAGYPGRARAAGQVMAANRLPLVLPCHRIVGSGGRLTGYSGGEGIKTKRWLLDFENRGLMKNI